MKRLRYAFRHPLRFLGIELINFACWIGLMDYIPHRHRMRIWKAIGVNWEIDRHTSP